MYFSTLFVYLLLILEFILHFIITLPKSASAIHEHVINASSALDAVWAFSIIRSISAAHMSGEKTGREGKEGRYGKGGEGREGWDW